MPPPRLRFLSLHRPCGPSFVLQGWKNVLLAMGHSFASWETRTKSTFDAFNEYEPDVVLSTTFDMDAAQVKCLIKRPHVKVALYASAWGELTKGLDLQKYPVVAVGEEEKKRISFLKEKTGNPSFVHLHLTPKYVEPVLGGWRELGVKPVGILNGADTFTYGGSEFREDLSCDVGVISGWWGYKARKMAPWLLPLCNPQPGEPRLKVKIWGNQPAPVHQYLGMLDESLVRHAFRSATVCPNLSEPHATDLWSDCPERVLKVIWAGGFCLSDPVLGLKEMFSPEEIVTATSPEDFREKVWHYVRHPEERLPFMEKGRERVRKDHSYFSRVEQLLRELDLPEYAGECREAREKALVA